MAAKTPSATATRQSARAKAAAAVAARLGREKKITDTLEKFFAADALIDTAAAKRDEAITKARRDYAAATESARVQQAQHTQALRGLDLGEREIAELTGQSVASIRKALKAASSTDTTPDTAPDAQVPDDAEPAAAASAPAAASTETAAPAQPVEQAEKIAS